MHRITITLFCFISSLSLHIGAANNQLIQVRTATFNTSLNFRQKGDISQAMKNCQQPRIKKIAAVIQRNKPDLILLNEFDYDPDGKAAEDFIKNCLTIPHYGQDPINYPYHYSNSVNTGEPSGLDLNQNGTLGDAGDAWGYGRFPGQYGMLVLSKLPIDSKNIRTFQNFLYTDMPETSRSIKPSDGTTYFPDNIWSQLRLVSKSFWDIPVKVDGKTIHFLVSHPTPPVFDGPEDRNGHRNHDEIRLLSDYLNTTKSHYIVDDKGSQGGLAAGDYFIIAGDMNADPLDGDSTDNPIDQLLDNSLVNTSFTPQSSGAVEAAKLQAGANLIHKGDAKFDTGDFNDKRPGNLRLDYVLPSQTLKILGGEVFWPASTEIGHDWLDASDHHLVYVDITL